MTDRDQLISDVLTSAVESGYPWFLYDKIDRDDDLNVTRVTGWVDDEGEYHYTGEIGRDWQTFDLTLAQFKAQLTRALFDCKTPKAYRELLNQIVFGDPGDADFDVVDADNLLQLAILGEVTYA